MVAPRVSSTPRRKETGSSGDCEIIKPQVYARIRPFRDDLIGVAEKCLVVSEDKTRVTCPTKAQACQYEFNYIYEEDTTQDQIWEDIGLPMRDKIAEGRNCTIFAYGQTGSGKTFTMFGPPPGDPRFSNSNKGIIPRFIEMMWEYEYAEKRLLLEMYEIECETVKDLSDPSRKITLKSQMTKRNQEEIITKFDCFAAGGPEETMEYIYDCLRNRTSAETNMNQTSSRSHCVIALKFFFNRDGDNYSSTIYLVDLAGSEKLSQSGAEGHLKKQAININQGLLFLRNSIDELADPKRRDNPTVYRRSALTLMLSDIFAHPNCCLSLIVNVAPENIFVEETNRSFEFGNKTKKVEIKSKINSGRGEGGSGGGSGGRSKSGSNGATISGPQQQDYWKTKYERAMRQIAQLKKQQLQAKMRAFGQASKAVSIDLKQAKEDQKRIRDLDSQNNILRIKFERIVRKQELTLRELKNSKLTIAQLRRTIKGLNSAPVSRGGTGDTSSTPRRTRLETNKRLVPNVIDYQSQVREKENMILHLNRVIESKNSTIEQRKNQLLQFMEHNKELQRKIQALSSRNIKDKKAEAIQTLKEELGEGLLSNDEFLQKYEGREEELEEKLQEILKQKEQEQARLCEDLVRQQAEFQAEYSKIDEEFKQSQDRCSQITGIIEEKRKAAEDEIAGSMPTDEPSEEGPEEDGTLDIDRQLDELEEDRMLPEKPALEETEQEEEESEETTEENNEDTTEFDDEDTENNSSNAEEIERLYAENCELRERLEESEAQLAQNEQQINKLTQELEKLQGSKRDMADQSIDTAEMDAKQAKLEEEVRTLKRENETLRTAISESEVMLRQSQKQLEEISNGAKRIEEKMKQDYATLSNENMDLLKKYKESESSAKRLKKKIDELDKANKQSAEIIAHRERENEQLCTKVKETERSVQELKSKLDEAKHKAKTTQMAYEKKNDELQSKLKEFGILKNKLDATETELKEQLETAEKLGKDLESTKKQLELKEQQYDTATKENNNLQTLLQKTEAQLQEEKQLSEKLTKESSELRSMLDAVTNERDNLQSEYNAKCQEAAKLQENLAGSESTRKNQEEKIDQLSTEATEMRAKITELTKTEADLRAKLCDREAQINQQEEKIAELSSELKKLKKSLENKEGEVTSLVKDIDELRTKLATMERIYNEARDRCTKLEKKLKQTKWDLEVKTHEYNMKAKELEEIKSRLDETETKLQEEQAKNEQLSKDLAAAKKDLERKEHELALVSQENTDLQQRMSQTEQMLREQYTNVERLMTESKELKEKMTRDYQAAMVENSKLKLQVQEAELQFRQQQDKTHELVKELESMQRAQSQAESALADAHKERDAMKQKLEEMDKALKEQLAKYDSLVSVLQTVLAKSKSDGGAGPLDVFAGVAVKP